MESEPSHIERVYRAYLEKKLRAYRNDPSAVALTPEQWNAFERWAIERLLGTGHGSVVLGAGGQKSYYRLFDKVLRDLRRDTSGDKPRIRALQFVQVTCLGATVGTASIHVGASLATAIVVPSAAYDLIAPAARTLGAWLSETSYWPDEYGDLTEEAAARWDFDRVTLRDEGGRDLAAAHVILVEAPRGREEHARIQLVADFRANGGRRGAFIPLSPRGGRGESD